MSDNGSPPFSVEERTTKVSKSSEGLQRGIEPATSRSEASRVAAELSAYTQHCFISLYKFSEAVDDVKINYRTKTAACQNEIQ